MEQAEHIGFALEIQKAVVEDGLRVVYLEAHSEDPDLQEETIYVKGLKESSGYFLKNGFLDWHHTGEKRKNVPLPKDIIGFPLDLRFKGKKVYVKAVLHEGDPIADDIWKGLHYKPPKRYSASIAGKRVKTFQKANGVHTTKLIWTSLAITPSPVNDNLESVSLTPYTVFLKALSSSAETDLAQVTGGQALSDVDEDEKPARIVVKSCDQWCEKNGAFRKGLQKKDIVTYVTRYLGMDGDKAKTVCKTLWQTLNPAPSAKGRSNAG